MGTSTSSPGANDRSPLVPPWADTDGAGPGPEPEDQRFRGFRTSLGRFVASGDRDHLQKAVRNYAKTSTGGSAVAPRRFSAMAQAGSALFAAINQLRGDPSAAPVNLRDLAGRSTREVIDALVDALVPDNGDADRIRAALNEALSECLEGVEEFDFSSIGDEVLVELMVRYVALCVFQDIVLNSRDAFAKASRPEDAERAEAALLALVHAVVDKHMAPLLQGDLGQMSPAQMQAVQTGAIREVWREWEAS